MSTPQLFLPNYGFSLSSGYATSSQEADYGGVAEVAVPLGRAECHMVNKWSTLRFVVKEGNAYIEQQET